MRTLTLVIAFAAFLIGSARGQAVDDPSGMWMIGFLQIQDAVKAESDDNTALAVGKFQQALWTFHDIARRFPAFESGRRAKRIRILGDKIRSLGGIPIALAPLVRTPATVVNIPQSSSGVALDLLLSLPSNWVAKKEGGLAGGNYS